jgi:hypothetical protein
MKRGFLALTLLAFSALAFNGSAFGAMAKPKLPDKPLPAEVAFVQQVTKDLNTRFPTPADAEKAGYFRYNNEDKTGAISYANLQWNSAKDPGHPEPSQLWYDVKGHLLGADFSVPLSAKTPNLWGLNSGRWFKVAHDHVHYILKSSGGALSFGHALRAKTFTAAGGDLSDPQAATIVKLGKAKNVDQVAKVFTYPAQWNLEVWLTPNPLGAFAETNPLVHPSKKAGASEM